MKTNLIFRRQIVDNGIPNTEVRVVEVELPEAVKKGEGWILWGQADDVQLCIPCTTAENTCIEVTDTQDSNTVKATYSLGDSFICDVEGTSKLVRRGNEIKIVYRKGKATLNKTSPNSVCIDNMVRREFFNQSQRSGWVIRKSDSEKLFNYWSTFMDAEYMRQLDRANKHS